MQGREIWWVLCYLVNSTCHKTIRPRHHLKTSWCRWRCCTSTRSQGFQMREGHVKWYLQASKRRDHLWRRTLLRCCQNPSRQCHDDHRDLPASRHHRIQLGTTKSTNGNHYASVGPISIHLHPGCPEARCRRLCSRHRSLHVGLSELKTFCMIEVSGSYLMNFNLYLINMEY